MAMHFISLSHFSGPCLWILSLSYFSGSCLFLQVLDIKIFKGHALHIIVVYQWVVSLTLIYKYRYQNFQRLCTSYHCCISVGLVFDSYIQVLGIRYFQRPCTSYHCRISVGLVFESYHCRISVGLVSLYKY